jgi:hypothetical protein
MLASAESRRKNRVCRAWRSEALRGCIRANREDQGDRQTDRQTDRKNRKGTIAIAQIDSTDKQTDKITIVGALSQ